MPYQMIVFPKRRHCKETWKQYMTLLDETGLLCLISSTDTEETPWFCWLVSKYYYVSIFFEYISLLGLPPSQNLTFCTNTKCTMHYFSQYNLNMAISICLGWHFSFKRTKTSDNHQKDFDDEKSGMVTNI